MLYLDELNLNKISRDWDRIISVVSEALNLLGKGDYAQPIKPYLRFRNPKNRIIAMPAYLGGENACSGIKWIASFPLNINNGIKRAHSLTVLNDIETGAPFCIINTDIISGIRTAAVSGLMIQKFLKLRKSSQKLTVGICGFGPIGQLHLDMVRSKFSEVVDNYIIYDIRDKSADIPKEMIEEVRIVKNWSECYNESDIFITCTVANQRYINLSPVSGSLQLNISLRDYFPEVIQNVKYIVVDDWEEICRENTDIEMLYKYSGLKKSGTISLFDFIYSGNITLNLDDTVMFNPMGLAVFDIATAYYYFKMACDLKIGVNL